MVPQEGEHGVNDFGGHAGGGVVVEIINFLLAHKVRKSSATELRLGIYKPAPASSRKSQSPLKRRGFGTMDLRANSFTKITRLDQ
jgi:hypothetical protein